MLVLLPLIFVLLLSGSPTTSAEIEGKVLLSEADTKLFLKGIQNELAEYGILNLPVLQPEEQVGILFARDAARKAVFDFLPGFIATETVKAVLKVATFAKNIPEVTLGDLIGELEKRTVQEAVSRGTDWLLQNNIKVSGGTIAGSYDSYWGGSQVVQFQYLMTYAEQSDTAGRLVFEFYSADPINPPARSNQEFPWELGDWLKKNKKKLDPFVVHAEFQMEKLGLGWVINSSAKKKITVEFPEKVPRLQLTKELPYPLEEKKRELLNVINTVEKVLKALESLGNKTAGRIGEAIGSAQTAAGKLIDLLSQLKNAAGAGIGLSSTAPVVSSTDSVEQGGAQETESRVQVIFDVVTQPELPQEVIPENFESVKKSLALATEQLTLVTGMVTKLKSVSVLPSPAPAPSEPVVSGAEPVEGPTPTPTSLPSLPPPPPPPIVTYPKILISEVQVEGETAKDEFVELYNPNSQSADLGGWSLKRKTSTGSDANLVSASAFTGTIVAYGYFLIVPQPNSDGTPTYKGAATPDLFYSGKTYSIASDNTVLLLKPNGEISDIVGFGAAKDSDGALALNPPGSRSLSRKFLVDEGYQSTGNNLQDFQVVLPTPRALNPGPVISGGGLSVAAPPPPPPPPPPSSVSSSAASSVSAASSASSYLCGY
ncbi:MAG: hypothetical protein Greene041639_121 [Parcubacteria group bacterium Greene0416_39]|nr:MAG: hypothetical protein Greene041639_121 [Parcubacteria group bacterium Greene0416_39]